MTRQGTRRLAPGCSEQGKLPAAKAFTLAERDKHMSEQKQSFMQQLDAWTTATVINPLHQAVTDGDSADCEAACEAVKIAIRLKVLESYHNGQAAGPRPPRKEQRGNVKTQAR